MLPKLVRKQLKETVNGSHILCFAIMENVQRGMGKQLEPIKQTGKWYDQPKGINVICLA